MNLTKNVEGFVVSNYCGVVRVWHKTINRQSSLRSTSYRHGYWNYCWNNHWKERNIQRRSDFCFECIYPHWGDILRRCKPEL